MIVLGLLGLRERFELFLFFLICDCRRFFVTDGSSFCAECGTLLPILNGIPGTTVKCAASASQAMCCPTTGRTSLPAP